MTQISSEECDNIPTISMTSNIEKFENMKIILRNGPFVDKNEDFFNYFDELLSKENSPNTSRENSPSLDPKKYKSPSPNPILRDFFDFIKENQHLLVSEDRDETLREAISEVEAEFGDQDEIICQKPEFL